MSLNAPVSESTEEKVFISNDHASAGIAHWLFLITKKLLELSELEKALEQANAQWSLSAEKEDYQINTWAKRTQHIIEEWLTPIFEYFDRPENKNIKVEEKVKILKAAYETLISEYGIPANPVLSHNKAIAIWGQPNPIVRSELLLSGILGMQKVSDCFLARSYGYFKLSNVATPALLEYVRKGVEKIQSKNI